MIRIVHEESREFSASPHKENDMLEGIAVGVIVAVSAMFLIRRFYVAAVSKKAACAPEDSGPNPSVLHCQSCGDAGCPSRIDLQRGPDNSDA